MRPRACQTTCMVCMHVTRRSATGRQREVYNGSSACIHVANPNNSIRGCMHYLSIVVRSAHVVNFRPNKMPQLTLWRACAGSISGVALRESSRISCNAFFSTCTGVRNAPSFFEAGSAGLLACGPFPASLMLNETRILTPSLSLSLPSLAGASRFEKVGSKSERASKRRSAHCLCC